ncbi:MAG TPA: kynureninase [Solirubrobacteraceae bacterium]|nr:kynureninase [Solirubrobacteraceae bacterium]
MGASQQMIDSREEALRRDREDPLAAFRAEFLIPEEEIVYMDGNSLGRPPRAVLDSLEQVVRAGWSGRLIRAWTEGWMDVALALGDRIGALLGAGGGQVAVADSTTVCFYKAAAAALDARPGRTEILTDPGNFPTDRYVLESLARQRGLQLRWLEPQDATSGPSAREVAAALSERTALVTFTHVDYRTAAILDMAAITGAAHAAGALTIWDLSHSVGAVAVELDAAGADLAVGCTYKYLCGGPGSPAFIYVRGELQASLRQPIWGWLGRRDPFAMEPGYEPVEGIRAFLSGTPPILALHALSAGVELVERAGIARIRAKGIALTEYAIALADSWLAEHGITVASPREAALRGAHVALAREDAQSLCQRLATRGVLADYRAPDVVRLGLSPLSTSFAEVWDALSALRGLAG